MSKTSSIPPLKNYETKKNDENEQYYYDLEKINVEWSGPLTTVSPKIITTSKKYPLFPQTFAKILCSR